MKRFKIILLMLLGFGLLTASDCSSPTSPDEPRGTATATALCGQDGAITLIFCRDQSSDPQGVVVENGVRFEASLIGGAFQASRLTSIKGQVNFDVTSGGYGTYIIDQALLDKLGRTVASESYSVPVVPPDSIVASAVRLGFVRPEDADAFLESLAEDRYGVAAVTSGLISATDAKTLGEMVFHGKVANR